MSKELILVYVKRFIKSVVNYKRIPKFRSVLIFSLIQQPSSYLSIINHNILYLHPLINFGVLNEDLEAKLVN